MQVYILPKHILIHARWIVHVPAYLNIRIRLEYECGIHFQYTGPLRRRYVAYIRWCLTCTHMYMSMVTPVWWHLYGVSVTTRTSNPSFPAGPRTSDSFYRIYLCSLKFDTPLYLICFLAQMVCFPARINQYLCTWFPKLNGFECVWFVAVHSWSRILRIYTMAFLAGPYIIW